MSESIFILLLLTESHWEWQCHMDFFCSVSCLISTMCWNSMQLSTSEKIVTYGQSCDGQDRRPPTCHVPFSPLFGLSYALCFFDFYCLMHLSYLLSTKLTRLLIQQVTLAPIEHARRPKLQAHSEYVRGKVKLTVLFTWIGPRGVGRQSIGLTMQLHPGDRDFLVLPDAEYGRTPQWNGILACHSRGVIRLEVSVCHSNPGWQGCLA